MAADSTSAVFDLDGTLLAGDSTGLALPTWSYAYSDSVEDAPILARARQAFLVNARPRVLAGLQGRQLPQLSGLRW